MTRTSPLNRTLAVALGMLGFLGCQLFPFCSTCEARTSGSDCGEKVSIVLRQPMCLALNPSTCNHKILSIEIAPLGQPLKLALDAKLPSTPLKTQRMCHEWMGERG
jgi:hypothetical protein